MEGGLPVLAVSVSCVQKPELEEEEGLRCAAAPSGRVRKFSPSMQPG